MGEIRSGEGALSMMRLGRWTALASFFLGIGYVIAIALGMTLGGTTKPIGDPVLAAMELLTLIGALLLVVVMAAVREYADAEHKSFALIAFGFTVLLAGVTACVHFVQLTAGRQGYPPALTWPSPAMALDWFAWDVFLGLAMLFAAPAFSRPGPERNTRRVLRATGVLCLAGVLGPATGRLPLQLVGVVGYGLLLTIACLMIALLMGRRASEARSSA